MIKAKIMALNQENLLLNNSAVHLLIKELEILLKNHYVMTFRIPKIKLEGFFSLTLILERTGKSIGESHIRLKSAGDRLRDLRLDLTKLEQTEAQARILRPPLDSLMDFLELPKDYYWLEKNFPGPAFREGIHRFYESEKDVFAAVISDIGYINRHISKDYIAKVIVEPHIQSLARLEVLEQTMRYFLQWTSNGVTEEFWQTFEGKTLFSGGEKILRDVWCEVISNTSAIIASSENDTRVLPDDPVIYPDHQRTRTILKKISQMMEHLIIQYHKLRLSEFDLPPDLNYMATLPEVDKAIKDIDKPIYPRKLQKLSHSS